MSTKAFQKQLNRDVLDGDADAQIRQYLHRLLPKFKAPTDPAQWKKQSAKLRRDAIDEVYLKGYPRSLRKSKPKVVWGETLKPHRDYVIRKLRYEVYPDFWVPALMYQPTKLSGKVPVVMNPNGHHMAGKAADYKQARCINLAKRGMIALNYEYLGMNQLAADNSHDNFAYLDYTGMAGVGLFFLAMTKGLNVLLDHKHADPKRVAVTGLSGGGWQTIVHASLDTRVTVVVPVAGYNSMRKRIDCHRDRGDLEQCPVDMGSVLDFQDMTAMLAPRPTLQIMNETDSCCFKTGDAKPYIYDAIRPTFKAMGVPENLQYYSNIDPGDHNYAADNRSQLYQFLNQHFGLDTPAEDLPYEKELFTMPQLDVEMPDGQLTAMDLAQQRALALCKKHRTPQSAADKRALRKRLVEVIRLPEWSASRPRRVAGSGGIESWRMKTGPLEVPVTVQRRKGSQRTVLLLEDTGRAGVANFYEPESDVDSFVPDLLGSGENKHNLRLLAMIDCLGQRVLGHRVAQLHALARWAGKNSGRERVEIRAYGPNSAFAAALAVALEPGLFSVLHTCELPSTLARWYDWRRPFEVMQPSLCFGLLEVADIPQILALMKNVEYRRPELGAVTERF